MEYPYIAIIVTVAVAAVGLILRYYFHSQSKKYTSKLAKISAGDRLIDNITKFYERALNYWVAEAKYSKQNMLSLELDAEIFFDDASRTLKIHVSDAKDEQRAKRVIKNLKSFQLSACPTIFSEEMKSSLPMSRMNPFILEFTTKMIEAKASVEEWVVEKDIP